METSLLIIELPKGHENIKEIREDLDSLLNWPSVRVVDLTEEKIIKLATRIIHKKNREK